MKSICLVLLAATTFLGCDDKA
ncbi:MAG: hypothetical protein JWM74_2377, partial [Myxococcaceae bacterium]|nr:hypothetical protein [Myxococcaceae bacterium]